VVNVSLITNQFTARNGKVRWETRADQRGHTSAPIVVEGKVISGGACAGNRENCYIAAHDARTGKLLWRFYTTPAPANPKTKDQSLNCRDSPLRRRPRSRNGAMLATAGALVFHGDMSRRFRAFDAETGTKLWETVLGGNVSVSTITYAAKTVRGRHDG